MVGTIAEKALDNLDLLLLAIVFSLAMSVLLFLDVSAAVTVDWRYTTIFTVLMVIIGALTLASRPAKLRILLLLLFLLTVSSLQFVDWNSRKPFLRDLNRIQVGMTRPQVEEVMGDYIIGTGWPASPNPESVYAAELTVRDTIIYRHTNEGWGDSDWGVITFENGSVVETAFFPD